MTTHIFKVLTYDDRFVNEKLLATGVYNTSLPILHPVHTDLITLKQNILVNANFLSETTVQSMLENLNRCELKIIELTFKDQ